MNIVIRGRSMLCPYTVLSVVVLGLFIIAIFKPIGMSAQDAPLTMRGDGTLRRIRVPILMYHYVSTPPPGSDEYRINLSIEPTMFRQHLQYLKDNGYTTISLYDLDAALSEGAALPAKPVVLTFDDGYSDHYVNAFPLLREFGMTATFFIITDTADHGSPNYMTWAQIDEMAAAGMSIESHTKTHHELRGRTYDFLVYEILGSLESVRAHTNETGQMFCYPVGRYDDLTLSVLASTDVLRAVTTEFGVWHTTDNRLEVPRVRISYNTGVNALAGLLSTAQ
jgi:peptidoglycan/xylan/chitin deacetylase (PgdA/CDA1 family)